MEVIFHQESQRSCSAEEGRCGHRGCSGQRCTMFCTGAFQRPSPTSCLADSFDQTKALELPKEHEMPPKDKYTVFSPHARGYRKGIHKVPKWTRVSSLSLALRLRLTHISAHSTDQPRGLLVLVTDIPTKRAGHMGRKSLQNSTIFTFPAFMLCKVPL